MLPEWMITLAQSVTHSPLTWFGVAVANWLGALFLGEMVSRRWREVAIWVPVALIATVAMRPWPKGPPVESAGVPLANQSRSVTHTVAWRAMMYRVHGGLYHTDTCERLCEGAPVMTEEQVLAAHIGPCPDCIAQPAAE